MIKQTKRSLFFKFFIPAMVKKSRKKTTSENDGAVQFQNLKKEIAQIKHQLENLRQFISEISQNSAFDKTDVEQTSNRYKELAMKLQERETTLKYREDLYEKHIVNLENLISERQRYLELSQQNQLFNQFPDLLEYYVNKQAQLSEQLQGLRTQLEET